MSKNYGHYWLLKFTRLFTYYIRSRHRIRNLSVSQNLSIASTTVLGRWQYSLKLDWRLTEVIFGRNSLKHQCVYLCLQGARMVRELFEMARSKKACLIFFDEIDAIGGARFDDGAGGDNEVQRTMLELINQLDGFDPRGNIKVCT
jgi:hypothetical protein